MCALGWQSYVPGAANVGATTLQGLGAVASGTYVPKAYQTVLLTILLCAAAPLFNTFLARRLPGIEGAVFSFYMLAFLAFLIALLVMGPRSSAKEVFTHFENDSGWNSIGTACFVAINGPVITLLGSDSAVHLAEEMKDASRNLPRAMLSYAAVNYAIGFIMLLAFMFVIGDVQSVLATSTGEPWIQVIWNATESKGATITMTAIVAFFFLFAAVNTNTTSSRQLYAFARDGGLPFSDWICKVSPQKRSWYRSDRPRTPQQHWQTDKTPTGLTKPPRSSQRCPPHPLHRLLPRHHPARIQRGLPQHPNHRQCRPHRLVHHLHFQPHPQPQLRKRLRQPNKTAPLLPR